MPVGVRIRLREIYADMYSESELYKPIPNLSLYLKRIGIQPPDKCDTAYLDSILQAHQFGVPFENLDIIGGHLPISLAIESIFDKVVTRKRGGYCFELNSLFNSALQACGYDAYPCLARVVAFGSPIHPALHRQTIVSIGGERYVCDVGFGGPQPGFALKLKDGHTGTALGQTFRIDQTNKAEDEWQISYLTKGKWEPTTAFSAKRTEEVDFIAPNFYCYTQEDILFVKSRIVNIRIPGGHKSIVDDLLIINKDGKRTEIRIEDAEQLSQILSTHFGIEK
jgi:N-hydroxyarylamine O-acetyltransferase